MVTSLVFLLLYGLYMLLQPNLVNVHHQHVVIQTFLGKPVYELQHGYHVTLGGPFFRPFRFLKSRLNQTIVRPGDRPALVEFRERTRPHRQIVISWAVTDPWQVATKIGLPVDWNDVGETIVMPAVLSTARTLQYRGALFGRLRKLEDIARGELRRRKFGLDIVALTVRDGSQDSEARQFGPAQRFSRHLARPEVLQHLPIGRTAVDIENVISRDQHLIKIENLAINYAIVDVQKFKQAFGHDNFAERSVAERIKIIVKFRLIREIAAMTSAELGKFDPIVLLRTGGRELKQGLQNSGIVIADISDEKTSYRVSLEPY